MTDLAQMRGRVLSDCSPEKSFWTCHGTVCRNIYELVSAVKSQNFFAFTYHVNIDHEKNDYAVWIRDVLGDPELATRLNCVFDKDRFADIIEQRIKELEESN